MNPFRNFFLYLSQHESFESFINSFPPTRKLVDRFVAGTTLDEALEIMRKLNEENIRVTLDYLGESIVDRTLITQALDEYMKILESIEGTNNSIAIKLTSLGLDISKEEAYRNVKKLLSRGRFIEIDMESSKYTQDTLDIYKQLRKEFPGRKLAVAIQSYLKRSMRDVRELVEYSPIIRIVKGAYKESKEVAYQRKKDVDRKFEEIMYYTLRNIPLTLIATHDERLINKAKNFVASQGIPRERFEFQFLYGIKNDLLRKLRDEGYRVSLYVPYGTHWYPYFMRRLAERPANVWFVFKNVFRA